MAEKSRMNKILNWKLVQIKQNSSKLKEVVDSYVSKIIGSAQVWIDRSEDYNQQSFFELTIQLDQTVLMLMEKTSEIESKLASQLLDACTLETTLKSATHLSSQINCGSQAIDEPVSSLQERIHSLESVMGSVQAGLDQCRKQFGSVEGMKANLQNLVSQVEVITNDKSVQQIQQEIEYYKSTEVVRMQNCEKTDDRLMVTEKKLTEMEEENKQVKLQMGGVIDSSKKSNGDVNDIREQLTVLETKISNITENNLQSLDARLQLLEEDKKIQPKTENTRVGEGNQAIAANKKEIQPRSTFTGFIASGGSLFTLPAFKTVMQFDIIAISRDTLFNKSTGEFTAPVDGTYMVIFTQKQIETSFATTGNTLTIIHSKEIHKKEVCVFKISTNKCYSHSFAKSQVDMSAGDRIFLSLSTAHHVEIPVFCCVLIG